MAKFNIATTRKQFKAIAQLANIIWREHYIPIIGLEQVDYMVKNYQSAEAMHSQHQNGYEYYMIYYNDLLIGYISIKKEDDSLFLSKIYVLKSGSKVLNFNPNHAHKSSLPCQVILGILKMLTIKNFIGDSF